MRRTVTLSTALAILYAALGFPTSASAEVTPVDISGPWKIDSQNGPSPICRFEQAGNNLRGSCQGQKGAGSITGTIIGAQVRWHWQWFPRASIGNADFDFIGTLRPDGSIKGMLEHRGIGRSLDFMAKRTAKGDADYRTDQRNIPSPPNTVGRTNVVFRQQQQSAVDENGRPTMTGKQNIGRSRPSAVDENGPPTMTGKKNHTGAVAAGETSLDRPPAVGRPQTGGSEDAYTIPPQLLRQANELFPWVGQQDQRTQYIIDQMNSAADRQQGHSYSIRIR